MKALDNAKAIYDLTMNERCEEKIKILFSNGLYKLMIDLIEELEDLENRSCDNCNTNYIKCKIFIAHWKKTENTCVTDSSKFYCGNHKNKA